MAHSRNTVEVSSCVTTCGQQQRAHGVLRHRRGRRTRQTEGAVASQRLLLRLESGDGLGVGGDGLGTRVLRGGSRHLP